ncbi:MAG: sigma-54 dependent transcriptional regulator [Myxococcota bacterium]|nr:sigma-54 dependent transcriptional regulator [Myxococcota bacterium]
MPRVLVVDDEPGVQESLRMLLKQDCEVVTAGDVDTALAAIEAQLPQLILLDLLMPGRNGIELLEELADRDLQIPVIVLTATKTVATAVEAMKNGAVDFITKPFELDALRMKVRQLLAHSALEEEVARLREEVRERQQLCGLVGNSPVMKEVFRGIERVAPSMASVVISGESGTGKELAARAIHELSPRHEGPYVAVNCGAIPHNLIEDELFGHERGAFTDAIDQRIGRFETASGGTLLLDEIGELAAAVQVKLLRVLQERRIERLGSSAPIDVDVRILAATNRNLAADVESGRFRADLYYRVNVVPIRMPALRERREDIRLLANRYLARAAQAAGRRAQLAPSTLAAMETYSWPGNVRELENAIEHGLALCKHDSIEVTDLPEDIVRSGLTESLRNDWRAGRVGFEETVGRFERELLREALDRAEGNQTRAASDLGITRRVLKLKLDRFGLDPGGKDEALPRA